MADHLQGSLATANFAGGNGQLRNNEQPVKGPPIFISVSEHSPVCDREALATRKQVKFILCETHTSELDDL